MIAPTMTHILVATEVEDDPVIDSVLKAGRKVAGTFYYGMNQKATASIQAANIRALGTGSKSYRDQTSARYWHNFITLHKITHLLVCDEKRRGGKRPQSIAAVLTAAVSIGISITFI